MNIASKRPPKKDLRGIKFRTPGESPFSSPAARPPVGDDHPARLLFQQIRAQGELSGAEEAGPESQQDAAVVASHSDDITESARIPPEAGQPLSWGRPTEATASTGGATASIGATSSPSTTVIDEQGGARAPRRLSNTTSKISFQEFSTQWGPVLKSGTRTGKLKICEVIYENTHAAGKKTFFTSYEKLAALCGLGKATTVKNIKQLEDLGFVERVSIYNTATKKGTELRLHLDRLSPDERKKPSIHLYDIE